MTVINTSALTTMSFLVPMCGAIVGTVLAMGSGAIATADPLPYGPDTCIQGFVWREAAADDHVCVTPDIRTQTAQQNSLATQNRDPDGGAYGPDTCRQGFVWREAFTTDHVCVVPAIRDQAATDNAVAASRVAADEPAATGTAAGTDQFSAEQVIAAGYLQYQAGCSSTGPGHVSYIIWDDPGFSTGSGGSGVIHDDDPALGGPFIARYVAGQWSVEYEFC